MKRTSFILFALLMAATGFAGEATWLTSLPEAAEQARKENELLLLDFTGSDWCGWCMKLDAETFSNPQFLDYASHNLVLVKLDFPRQKAQSDELKEANRALQTKYGVKAKRGNGSQASEAARLLRAIPSERRNEASRQNGKLGGRPRKKKNDTDHSQSK